MSRKEKWKRFGKNTAETVKDFGKAVARTANIAVGNEANDVEDNGKTKLRNAWTKSGKDFGKTGTSLGQAIVTTINGDDEAKPEPKEEPAEEKPVENEDKE